ncbi:RlpA-like double-psi beta-barrel-protein domain-containing protein-containing protein [Aspergillus cavernicola]|uniref:RlpA-like double-psi beta-barrel-protein domain-containing protein-containing protein n=1 Tax=Aspergillus cavernicola TaxID=176166 RepID=A0ABR4IC21_9EURO
MGYIKPILLTTLVLGSVQSAHAGLATTTHYSDGLQGACGCGTEIGTYDWQYGITHGLYTAAANQALFDPPSGMNHWCGSGCGKCYTLTSTGVSACETCGTGGEQGKSITVMVTNLCPYIGNEQWCPNPGQVNPTGYTYHFDIMGGQGVFGDNVVVEFEEVACPAVAGAKWGTCECHPGLRGTDLSDGNHTGGAGVVGPIEATAVGTKPAETGGAVNVPVPVAVESVVQMKEVVMETVSAASVAVSAAEQVASVNVETLSTVARPVQTVYPAPGAQQVGVGKQTHV